MGVGLVGGTGTIRLGGARLGVGSGLERVSVGLGGIGALVDDCMLAGPLDASCLGLSLAATR